MLRAQTAGKKKQLQEPQKGKPQLTDRVGKKKFPNKRAIIV